MSKAQSILRMAGRDMAYVLVMLSLSIVEFVVWVTGLSVTVSLLVLVVGVLVWLTTAYVFRGMAAVDRRVSGWYRGASIPGVYREPANQALLARVHTVTVDPQTWRDLGWLVVNSTLGFVLATVAITVTALAIGYVLMPLWWWAISDPSKQYATLNFGIYTVTSTGWAVLTMGLGLLLAPVALVINHAVAAGHAELATRILGPAPAGAGAIAERARSGAAQRGGLRVG
jgi:hypothetical protein